MATNTFIGPSSNQAVGPFFSVFDQTFQNYRSILTGSDAAGLQLYSAANVQRYTRTINNTNKKLRNALLKQITEEITTPEKDLNREILWL